jgi:hypothetical protein
MNKAAAKTIPLWETQMKVLGFLIPRLRKAREEIEGINLSGVKTTATSGVLGVAFQKHTLVGHGLQDGHAVGKLHPTAIS